MQRVLKFASDVIEKDGVRMVILSNEADDRDDDVVRSAGWELGNFSNAPRLMSCHDYGSLTKQIGEWRGVHIDPERKALVGEPHYYTGQGNAEADWAAYLASIGQATYSVGFAPLEAQPRKGHRGQEYLRQELLECSHVPIPSNPEALQLMAKAFKFLHGEQRQSGRSVRKWDSQYMGDPSEYGPIDTRCIVPGCDDASQTYVNVCSEHLKVLMNADAEPPGGEADEDIEAMHLAALVGLTKRRTKAGRQISSANMGKLHSAMQALGDIHAAACDAEDCPLDGDEAPPEARDKSKAANEGSGAAGGATVSDSGTHGAFDGKHDHEHSDQAGGLHVHAHSHDGSGDHGHSHSKGFDAAHFSADMEAAMTAALEKSAW